MEKIGRNDPCHCGSGKKYKNCHERLGSQNESRKKSIVIISIIGLLLVIAAIIIVTTSKSAGNSAPSGPAPAGKVWNEEHGHWHDI